MKFPVLKERPILAAVLAFILLDYFVVLFFIEFNHDQLEAIHTSWKMLQGERIYVDFFQHHHPLLYWILQPFILVFGENVRTIIILSFIFFGLMILSLWVLYKLSKLIFNDSPLALASVIFCVSFIYYPIYGWEIRPDTIQSVFGLLAWLLLLKWRASSRRWWMTWSAICLGLSFLSLQKALFLMAGIGIVQLLWLKDAKITFKQLWYYWLCFGLVISPFYIYQLAIGNFAHYYLLNWSLNVHFLTSFSPFDNLLYSFKENYVIWILYILGICLAKQRWIRETALLSVVLLFGFFMVRTPNPQYLMQFIPLMAIVAAAGLQKAVSDTRARLIIIFMATWLPLYEISKLWLTKSQLPNRTLAFNKLEFVLTHSGKQDKILDGQIEYNVFRQDVNYFWFSVRPGACLATYQTLKPYYYNVYEIIEKEQPRIINRNVIPNPDTTIIQQHYQPSEQFPELLIRVK